MTDVVRSPLHRILGALGDALGALGPRPASAEVERLGFPLHEALSSQARGFHTHRHVLQLVPGADPLEVIGALYHDLVYVQVDLGLPAGLGGVLTSFLREEEDGWRLLPGAATDPTARDVLSVFGRSPDQVLTPMSGLNELASALVVAKALEAVLARDQRLAVAACIEQTIPFRAKAPEMLAARLSGMGLAAEEVREMVTRAVRLANNDIGNFAEPDPARFLESTWRLLPEANPSLLSRSLYTVRDYRVALLKMERFLSGLGAESVFHAWEGEPAEAEHRRRVEAVRRNTTLAVRYLRAKLHAIAVLEALAMETGGDAPLEFFMGGIPEADGPAPLRAEQFLPDRPAHDDVEAGLLRLLEGGRTGEAEFDVKTSPIAAFLYRALGEEAVMSGLALARAYWAGEVSPRELLAGQPRDVAADVARAVSSIATTRREQLLALAGGRRG